MAVSSARLPLPGSERDPYPGAQAVGPIDPKERIEVSIIVHRRTPGQGVPEATPRSAMSREDFTARRGAHPADLARVEEFARASGLDVIDSNPTTRIVRVAGSAEALAFAFGVSLTRYQHPLGSFRGRTGAVMVPVEISHIVQAVVGLDDRPQARPHVRELDAETRKAAPKTAVPFTAPQLAALYGFPTGLNGAQQCIGIIELGGGYLASDLQAYFAGLGITEPTVVAVGVDGGANSPGNAADAEVALDIEVAGAIAPGARIAVYFAPNTDQGFLDAINAAVHDTQNNPSIISISWGAAESQWTAQSMIAYDGAFADASALGITVFCASGDSGSDDGVGDGRPHVDFPASSPHVVGCGGTHLEASNGAITQEVVWQLASGGGVSQMFTLPAYQASANVPLNPNGQMGRGVPDISGDADPSTGYEIILGGQQVVVGGTSGVAPLWAGLTALLNQGLEARGSGHSVGFLNPLLYTARLVRDLGDITVGSNGAYNAGPAWDPCTGLGSPRHLTTASLERILDVASTRVAQNADGRLEAFACGTDNALWHIWQTAPNNGWSGWATLGGVLTSLPYVMQNADGRLEVFARGTDNALWHIWQTAPNNGWSGWASLGGGITSDPVVFQNADGRLEAFARGTDNALWHMWQTAPNNGWSGWASLGGGITSDPVVFQNADGRLEAFARGTDNALWHIWQTAPNNGWSGWDSLGGVLTGDPVVVQNADGRLEVFVRGTDDALWHIWQTAPNNGWSGWASLGGVLGAMVDTTLVPVGAR